MEYSKTI